MYSVDDILAYLREHGAEVGQDNDGQLVLYTGLTEVDGKLVPLPST